MTEQQQAMYYPTPGTLWKAKDSSLIVLVVLQAFDSGGDLVIVYQSAHRNIVAYDAKFHTAFEPYIVSENA